MLLNDLYSLLSFQFAEDRSRITALVQLNKEHPVFKGHFPGNPILPGVCTVEIIRELVGKAMDKELKLCKAGSIKYLGFISPVILPEIQFDCLIKESGTGVILCTTTVSGGGNVLCSLKGELSTQDPDLA